MSCQIEFIKNKFQFIWCIHIFKYIKIWLSYDWLAFFKQLKDRNNLHFERVYVYISFSQNCVRQICGFISTKDLSVTLELFHQNKFIYFLNPTALRCQIIFDEDTSHLYDWKKTPKSYICIQELHLMYSNCLQPLHLNFGG